MENINEGWQKSPFSGTAGDCVELRARTVVEVRDSKNPDGPKLEFTPSEWDKFLKWARLGHFDVLPAALS